MPGRIARFLDCWGSTPNPDRPKPCKTIRCISGQVRIASKVLHEYLQFFQTQQAPGRTFVTNLLRDGHISEGDMRALLIEASSATWRKAVHAQDTDRLAALFERFCLGRQLNGASIDPEEWGATCFAVRGLLGFARRLVTAFQEHSGALANELTGEGHRVAIGWRPAMSIAGVPYARSVLRDFAEMTNEDRRSILRFLWLSPPDKVAWVTNDEEIEAAFRHGSHAKCREACHRLGLESADPDKVLLRYSRTALHRPPGLTFPTLLNRPLNQGLFRTTSCRSSTGRTHPRDALLKGVAEAVHRNLTCDIVLEAPIAGGRIA